MRHSYLLWEDVQVVLASTRKAFSTNIALDHGMMTASARLRFALVFINVDTEAKRQRCQSATACCMRLIATDMLQAEASAD